MAIKWKIYYSDGATFSNKDGGPELAPANGVQVIALLDSDHGWSTQAGADYYVWDDRGDGPKWWGLINDMALASYLFKPGWKLILVGESVPSNVYSAIFKRAQEDPDFGYKTGFKRRENKP